MRLRIVAEAEAEAQEAARWYDERQEGLGLAFLDALSEALEALKQHPRRHARVAGVPATSDIRRVLLKRFPYKVIDEIRLQEIVVLAVAHARRYPTYWRRRDGSQRNRHEDEAGAD